MDRHALSFVVLMLVVGAAATAQAQDAGSTHTAAERDRCLLPSFAEKGLDAVLQQALARPNIVNAVMLVQSPNDDFVWSRAGGVADPGSGELMTTDHQFRLASVAKMMTAVVVLQLIEVGLLSLDTRLGRLLDATDLPPGYVVDDLSIVGGRPYGRAITVRQLLNHTAGLRSYVVHTATEATFAADSLAAAVIRDAAEPPVKGIGAHQWTPEELLALYLDNGLGAHALAPPGQMYSYSDTGYLLLGLIIQKVTGTDLATQYRRRIFTPLGMTRSYLEWYEAPVGEGPAHHFIDLTPFGTPLNVDVVAAGVNIRRSTGPAAASCPPRRT
jgi:D-alanyl-D-alanine carboxypeptidase